MIATVDINKKTFIGEQLQHSIVSLSRQGLGDQGVEFIAMQPNCHIRELSLGYNRLSGASMLHFIKADWQNLTQLNLWDNNVGSIGCKYLTRANCHGLIKLDLQQNKIGSEGAKHIAKGEWRILQRLSLWDNKIATNGVYALAKANWLFLSYLDLKHNKIDEDSIKSIQLSQLPLLKQVRLIWNISMDCNKCILVDILRLKFPDIQQIVL